MTTTATRPSAAPEPVRLRLYIAGGAPTSLRAIQTLKAICERHPGNAYQLETIDVFREPERAIADGILVTPTLLKLSPAPVRTIIGDLREEATILAVLGITPPVEP
jgi:circadian clock protein KaiB